MKTLLILTTRYPYDNGEDFLTGELPYLHGFDQAIVCPCHVQPDSVQTRKLPEGVDCLPLHPAQFMGGYGRALSQKETIAELWRLARGRRLTGAVVHEMLYFQKKADAIYRALQAQLLPRLGATDAVTIYSYWLYDAAAAGARFAKSLRQAGRRVRLVSRCHGFDVFPQRAKYGYLPMRRYLLSSYDRIYPCSQAGARACIQAAPDCAPKIEVSYLGSQDYGLGPLPGKALTLFSCSYLVEVKRVPLLVRALSLLDFPLIWSHAGDGPARQAVEQAKARLPAQIQAVLLGQKGHADLMAYYQQHPVSWFLNVSASEGVPVSIMEAFSFGIPVIATDVGGTGELVRDGVNGFLLPADPSAAQIAACLRRAAALSPTQAQAFRAAARRTWELSCSAEKNFGAFYDELEREVRS